VRISRTCIRTFTFAAVTILLLAGPAFARPGRLDLKLGINFRTGGKINAVEVQADGKVLVGGWFEIVGQTRRDLIRLNTDNTIDTSFTADRSQGPSEFFTLKIQPDGQILAGGPGGLVRFNADGSRDTSFALSGINVTFVYDVDLQSTGKILASALNNAGTSFVLRFSTTGVHDPSFNFPFIPGSGFRIDVGGGDKVILGGVFNYTVGQNQFKNLARLGPDGALDTTFASDVAATTFPSVDVTEIDGGRVLIWGRFDFVNGLARRGVAIVNSDGSTNTQFDPSVIQVETIRVAEFQPDGKVLIGGENFNRTNTLLRGNIARLNADGSIDPTFFQGRGANGAVRVLRLRGTDRLLVGGDFVRYDRISRRNLAQIFV
jgi:uncharacterized delta-60 repeat protein